MTPRESGLTIDRGETVKYSSPVLHHATSSSTVRSTYVLVFLFQAKTHNFRVQKPPFPKPRVH